jgi:hypothetical protein
MTSPCTNTYRGGTWVTERNRIRSRIGLRYVAAWSAVSELRVVRLGAAVRSGGTSIRDAPSANRINISGTGKRHDQAPGVVR